MTDAFERIKEAHYRTTGRQVTGRWPSFNGVCPLHRDRHRSDRIYDHGHKISVDCYADEGCPHELILEAYGLQPGTSTGTKTAGVLIRAGTPVLDESVREPAGGGPESARRGKRH